MRIVGSIVDVCNHRMEREKSQLAVSRLLQLCESSIRLAGLAA
jgi:hypothetical protein